MPEEKKEITKVDGNIVRMSNGTIVMLTWKQTAWALKWAIDQGVLTHMPKIDEEHVKLPRPRTAKQSESALTDLYGAPRRAYNKGERRQTMLELIAKDDQVWTVAGLAGAVKANVTTIYTDLNWLKEQKNVIVDRKHPHLKAGKGNPIQIHWHNSSPKSKERLSTKQDTVEVGDGTKFPTKFKMSG